MFQFRELLKVLTEISVAMLWLRRKVCENLIESALESGKFSMLIQVDWNVIVFLVQVD